MCHIVREKPCLFFLRGEGGVLRGGGVEGGGGGCGWRAALW